MKQASTYLIRKAISVLCLLLLLTAPSFAQNTGCNVQFHQYSLPHNADSVYFYASIPSGTTAQFTWNFGDNTNESHDAMPWHLYANNGLYKVCVTVIVASPNASTCTATICDSLHVGVLPPPPPVCNAHFQHYSLLNPDSVHFYAGTAVSATAKYSWTFGDNNSGSHDPFPWHFYTHDGTYQVCLTVMDSTAGGKCTDTFCDSIHIATLPPPVCNAHFVHYSLTNNIDSVHFYVTPANATGTKYYWSFGDNTQSSTQPSPWHLYTHDGTYRVCLYISDSTAGGKCTAEWCDSAHIQTPPRPICNAHFQDYTLPHNPDSAHFYSVTASTTAKYTWDFGDHSPGSHNVDPWHVYAPGVYNVCLTVSDSSAGGKCTDTFCDSIHIMGTTPPSCNAHFTTVRPGSVSDMVYFISPTNPQGTNYSWNFGDNTPGSSDPNSIHTYTHDGVYWACLTVTNTAVPCHEIWCDSIHIKTLQKPNCNAHFVHYSISSNADSIHFYVTPANATGAKYSWTFGDNSNGSDHADPWHLYGGPGTYQVCLTVTDTTPGGRCMDTWCDSIHITAPHRPLCDAHFQHYSLHNPDSVHFYSNTAASTTTKYLWTFGDNTSSRDRYPWHFYANHGVYEVCLTVTDSSAGGKCSDTWCDSIHIFPPPPSCNAHFTHVSANATNTAIHFIPGTNPPGTAYSWDFGDQSSVSTSQDPTHQYANEGVYWVCLTVINTTNTGLCTATWCDSIHVGIKREPCDAHFTFITGAGVNFVYFIHAPNAPGTNYSWNFGDGSTSSDPNALHQFTNPGSYWVCLTVLNTATACRATFCDSMHVGKLIFPVCNANFIFTPGPSPHSLYFLGGPNPPSTKYLWTFGDGDSAGTADVFHQYAAAGTYRVCLTVVDTVALCSDSRCLTIGPLRLASGGSTADVMSNADDAIVTVYPNPMTESAVVHIENAGGTVTFRMYDNTGRLVKVMNNLTNGDFEFSKQGLGAGLYFYEVNDATSNLLRGKLIIE